MIILKQVCKSFGKLKAIDDLDVEFSTGKSYALIGPNGSGKTTLIKSILGMVLPSSGEIFFDNKSIKGNWSYRELIGYMPQIGRYPDNMRIGQLFDMMKNIRKNSFVVDEELLEAFSLEKLFDKRMHTLSGGTRQKVSAALAFLFNPPVLILDEPTAGLDPLSVEILKDKIQAERQKGKLILITSHVMSDLDDLTSDLIYLFEGKVRYASSIDELKDSTGETRLGKAIARFMTEMKFHETNDHQLCHA